jgi:hypothetical protein
MSTTLVTFGTRAFRFRQMLFGASATSNGVVDRVEHWSPQRLAAAGFPGRDCGVRLSERGAGFWSWKPFVIHRSLEAVNDGELVFYSDVGRAHVRLLRTSLAPFLGWMDDAGQDCLPGVEIPWHGPMSTWTKRDAFVLLGMDEERHKAAIPIQASFSLWRKTPATVDFVREWRDACRDRRLVSDDPSTCGLPEAPDFREHRHDQSVLSLLCFKHGLRPLRFAGDGQPGFPDRAPEDWLHHLGARIPRGGGNLLFVPTATVYQFAESILRRLPLK